VIYQGDHIGIAGTTPVQIMNAESGYAARCSIVIMGATNMDKEGFEVCTG